MAASPRVLLVEDEPHLLDLMELTLVKMGLETDRAVSVAEAQGRLAQTRYDLCLTDMRLTDGEGLEVIATASVLAIPVPVAVITAYGNAGNAVAALKAGAFDYLSKPVALDQLRGLLPSKLRCRLITFDSLPISFRVSLVDGRLAADDNEAIGVTSSDNAEPLI